MAILDRLPSRYDLLMFPLERLFLRRLRRRLFPYMSGRVLELGVGTGANIPLYGASVELTAVDLSESMLQQARRRPSRAKVNWVQADVCPSRSGDALPFVDDSFDRVTSSLLFCSLADPRKTLKEIRRVLRPGGWLTLLEHVRGETGVMRRVTDLLACPWEKISHSCHLDRDTADMIEASGFKLVCTRRHVLDVVQIILARNPR